MTIALPLVGEVAVEVLIIFALLLVLGAQALVKLVAALFSYVPFIGGWIQSNLEGALGGALSRVSGWLWASAKGVVSLIWRPVTWIASLIGHLADGLWAAMQMGERIVTSTIPNALGAVWHGLNDVLGQALNAAHWALSQAQGFASGLYNQAISLLHQFEGWVGAQLSALGQTILADVTALYNALGSAIHNIGQWVLSVVGQVRDALVVAFNHTIGVVWDQLGQRINVTDQWVDQQIKGVEAELPVFRDIAIATAEAALTPAIARALEQAVTAEGTIDEYLNRCGNNLCSGLNDLSSLLQQLGKLFEEGALFALVAAAATHPAEVARDVESVISPIATEAATLFRDATGVAA